MTVLRQPQPRHRDRARRHPDLPADRQACARQVHRQPKMELQVRRNASTNGLYTGQQAAEAFEGVDTHAQTRVARPYCGGQEVTEVELRNYLAVVVRRRRIILYVALLGLVLGAAASALRTPVYRAATSVLLQPNNPAERVTPDPGGYFDPVRYATDQVTVITGEEVLQQAASALGTSRQDLARKVVAEVGDNSGVVTISVVDTAPRRASAAANAVAEAYIEDRKRAEVTGLRRAAAQIEVQLKALSEQIAELRRDPQASGASAALEAANLQYTDLFSRQQDLLIDASLKSGSARVVSAATPPKTPEGISLPVSTLLGGLLGLMIGLGIAFLRDQLDDRLRGRAEVEEITGLPVLADLPVDRQLARQAQRLAMQDEPLGAFAEATRALRTSISFLGVEEPIRSILVSSAVPGEGKTVVAANLAAAFAQAGSRTVLVSADLRRPRLDGVFNAVQPANGLSTVLAAPALQLGRHSREAEEPAGLRAALEASLQRTELPDLYILPAGITPPNPAELLGSSRMDAVLRELDGTFDVVILDATPIVPVTDAAALTSKVTHVLLVASAGTSRRRSVQRMMEITRLTDARVLGVVLNRAMMQGPLAAGYYAQAPSSTAIDRAVPRPSVNMKRRRVDSDAAEPASAP